MELAILLAVLASIVWVLTTRSRTIPTSVGTPIFWILVVGAVLALVFNLAGGGPPDRVPPA